MGVPGDSGDFRSRDAFIRIAHYNMRGMGVDSILQSNHDHTH